METVQPTINRIKIILEGEYLKLAKVLAIIKKTSETWGFKYKVEQER